MHPLGHLSGKAAQNKWKTKWQFSRKAVFLTLQLKHFKPGTVFSTSSFLLCLALFKLQCLRLGLLGKAVSRSHLEIVAQRCRKQWRKPAQPPHSQCRQHRGYREALLCCKPASFHLQPNFTGKEAYSSFGELWKPNPVPSLVPLVPPSPHPSPTGAVLGLQLCEHKPTAPIPAMYNQLSIASADGFGH